MIQDKNAVKRAVLHPLKHCEVLLEVHGECLFCPENLHKSIPQENVIRLCQERKVHMNSQMTDSLSQVLLHHSVPFKLQEEQEHQEKLDTQSNLDSTVHTGDSWPWFDRAPERHDP